MDVWTIAGGVVLGVVLLIAGFIVLAFTVRVVRGAIEASKELIDSLEYIFAFILFSPVALAYFVFVLGEIALHKVRRHLAI